MSEFVLGILWFTGLVLILTAIILFVRAKLIASNDVTISVNNEKTILAPVGTSLLSVLYNANIMLPSACGGKGTCGQCKVAVTQGGGSILATEAALLKKRDIKNHLRLACQLSIKNNMCLQLAPEILGVKKWLCTVHSNHNVTTFIKEIILSLPAGEKINFRAGGYIMLEAPAFECSFKDFLIDHEYKMEWDRYDLWRYQISSNTPALRAYSMANYPLENDIIILNVRIALPPLDSQLHIPPGVVSSYIFNLKSGDTVNISGPYGEFFARDTDNEMVFIGGGAGMAPMRSHIFDQLLRLKTKRKISFWYGARNQQELFYKNEFDELQATHDNFQWTVALSDPKPEDHWTGEVGLIHQIIESKYLRHHPAPEDCEYYLCGPPMMNAAVIKMLEDLGVDNENILLDNF